MPLTRFEFSRPARSRHGTLARLVTSLIGVAGWMLSIAWTAGPLQAADADEAQAQVKVEAAANADADAGADADAKADAKEGWVDLFDGKSFEGWEGNLDWFRIEDGCIVAGKLDGNIPRNEFLATQRTFGDFELRLQTKLVGEGANAGIQFRSKRIPNHHEVIGYQADMGDTWWGKLYDESRRNRILAGDDRTAPADLVRRGEWNDYRIVCQGNRIQLFLNGRQTVDYTEPDAEIARDGMIAVQIHSGPPSEAWYRRIQLRPLAAKGAPASP